MSFYRKYRPQNFSSLVGQQQVSLPLLKQLETGKISHAYLFSGPRGTGKTSTARIFAKALNCEKYKDKDAFGEPCNKCTNCQAITDGRYLDVLEIDAASNRGIDEIRDLREKIKLAPTSGKYKVYIIDEVHMLTNEAFNALLKTLEEPPEHAVFILATTEIYKIPATIKSRSQCFEFARPSQEQIVEKLRTIEKEEKLSIPASTIATIASIADGAFRDAEVLFDKIVSVASESPEEIEKILGKNEKKEIIKFLNILLIKKTKEAVEWIGSFVSAGKNLKILNEEILETLREAMLVKVGVTEGKKYSPEVMEELKNFANQASKEKITNFIALFSQVVIEMKDSPIPSLPLELATIEACEFNTADTEVRTQEPETNKNSKENTTPNTEAKKSEKVDEISSPKVGVETIVVNEEPEKKIEKVEVKLTAEEKEIHGNVREVSIEEIQKEWGVVLNTIREKNRSLEIFLRAATPIGLKEEILLLEVGYSFHKERLEETKNRELLTDTFLAILGRPVRIKAIVNESKPKPVRSTKDQVEEADPIEIFGKLV